MKDIRDIRLEFSQVPANRTAVESVPRCTGAALVVVPLISDLLYLYLLSNVQLRITKAVQFKTLIEMIRFGHFLCICDYL